jgi:hypothetical protein
MLKNLLNFLETKIMKTLLLLFPLLLLISKASFAQSEPFTDESEVISYMDSKTFYNSDNGLEISYGYISIYNTYGIKVLNMNGAKFYFINVEISAYGNSADLFGMSPDDGSNFGFRLFKGKLIVGYGEEGQSSYFLK